MIKSVQAGYQPAAEKVPKLFSTVIHNNYMFGHISPVEILKVIVSEKDHGIRLKDIENCFSSRGNPDHIPIRRSISQTVRTLEVCGYIKKECGKRFFPTAKGASL